MIKGTIYKIYCKNPEIKNFYIGSSCNLKRRIMEHKSSCNNINSHLYNIKLYKFIRNNGGWDNWEFEILLEVNIEDKKQLILKYERNYILDLKPSLNVKVEGRTLKEYYKENYEKINEYKKEYYNKNKEEINKERKEYRLNNKNKIKEQKKEYYNKNKEEISKKNKVKIECECGSIYNKRAKSVHIKSIKHKTYINK